MHAGGRASEPERRAAQAPAARRPVGRSILIILALHAAFVVALLALHACASLGPVRLQGYDVPALPGGAVRLRAKLELDGPGLWNPDIHGRAIRFTAGGEAVGTAETGGDGIAAIDWKAPATPGIHPIRLALADPRGVKIVTARPGILLQVLPPDARIIVCDIDGTISEGELGDLFGRAGPLPYAQAMLRELARDYRIVYLTARDDALMARTHAWLRHHGFPEGAVLFRDLRLTTLSSERYKSRVLRSLKKKWKRIVWGIGNTAGDAAAYTENGIRAIIVGAERDEEEGGTTYVRDWRGVARKILGRVPEIEK